MNALRALRDVRALVLRSAVLLTWDHDELVIADAVGDSLESLGPISTLWWRSAIVTLFDIPVSPPLPSPVAPPSTQMDRSELSASFIGELQEFAQLRTP